MNSHERAYTTKEVSSFLDIGTSTLRKWCISLEENGYSFTRVDNNKRLFLERDLVSLKYYKKLLQDENFSMSNASKIVASKHTEEASDPRTPTVLEEKPQNERSPSVLMNELLDHIKKQDERAEKQEEFNRHLLERINKQDELLEERLKERDKKLMETLNEARDAKQLLLEAKKENKEGKGFFAKLFKK